MTQCLLIKTNNVCLLQFLSVAAFYKSHDDKTTKFLGASKDDCEVAGNTLKNGDGVCSTTNGIKTISG